MSKEKTEDRIMFDISWKTQILSSAMVGGFFGFYHYILSRSEIWTFFYFGISTGLLSMGLWQAARLVFRLTDKRFPWFEKPYRRIIVSLVSGVAFTYMVVFIADFGLPYAMDPLFGIDSRTLTDQPSMTLATFFLDGAISVFIFQFYLTLINLFSYFRDLRIRRDKDIAQTVEKYFETLIENIHDVIQVIGASGELLYCSSSIKGLTGYTADEVRKLGSGFALIHPENRSRVVQEFETKVKEGFDTYSTHYEILTREGTIRHIETKVINASSNPKLKGYIAINSDITDRLLAEERTRHQKELYRLLTDMSTRFLGTDLEHAVKQMLEEIGRFAEVDRSYVYLLNEAKNHWDCLHEWRSEAASLIASNFYQAGIPVETSSWLFGQVQGNAVINFENTEQIPAEGEDFKAICKADQTKSVLLIPMLRHGKIYGFMGFDSVQNHKIWKEEDVSTLQICSEILISSMLRREAEQRTERSLSVNKAIVDSTSEGILLTDLDDNILYYNQNFKDMWLFTDEMLKERKKSIALQHAIRNVENADEVFQIISTSEENVNHRIRLVAYLKNKRVLEGISQPQIIDGKVVGRVWSNRDITERVNAEKEEIEKGIAQAQFESLKNQVNPHFLFNSLNVLSSLVHIDPNLSEKFIDQLARSYRYLLEQKDNELVLLKTEMDFVQAFTFLLKIRFEEKLQVQIHLSDQVMQYYVAPLTLQLLIENAVKHNIISAETPLKIEIFNEGDEYLIVRNNLQRREQQLPSTGVGLRNIRSRYKLLTARPTEFYTENSSYIARIPLLKTMQS